MTCVDVPDLRHSMAWKPAVLHPGARAEIRELPRTIRKRLGMLIEELQWGQLLKMPHSRPMPIIASGVEELRVKDESGQYRAFVMRRSHAGIVVLHVFAKKSQKTPRAAIELARRRLKEI